MPADYTQAQLAAARAALASGALRVTYDGKTVEYRSISELKEAIGIMEASIDAAAGTARRRSVRIYANGKGN